MELDYSSPVRDRQSLTEYIPSLPEAQSDVERYVHPDKLVCYSKSYLRWEKSG
jgi:hypothetical protein